MNRRACRTIRVRDVEIGGSAPISVQSMTNTDTRDAMATLAQIEKLHKAVSYTHLTLPTNSLV